MESREIIKILKRDGWMIKRTAGSHHHFVHPTKKGLVTVPHPKHDFPTGAIRSIERQAGIKFIGGR